MVTCWSWFIHQQFNFQGSTGSISTFHGKTQSGWSESENNQKRVGGGGGPDSLRDASVLYHLDEYRETVISKETQ